MENYRGFIIVHNPKPIGIRAHDFDYHHEVHGLDGPDTEPWAAGTAGSVEDAKAKIDEGLLDHAADLGLVFQDEELTDEQWAMLLEIVAR